MLKEHMKRQNDSELLKSHLLTRFLQTYIYSITKKGIKPTPPLNFSTLSQLYPRTKNSCLLYIISSSWHRKVVRCGLPDQFSENGTDEVARSLRPEISHPWTFKFKAFWAVAVHNKVLILTARVTWRSLKVGFENYCPTNGPKTRKVIRMIDGTVGFTIIIDNTRCSTRRRSRYGDDKRFSKSRRLDMLCLFV